MFAETAVPVANKLLLDCPGIAFGDGAGGKRVEEEGTFIGDVDAMGRRKCKRVKFGAR